MDRIYIGPIFTIYGKLSDDVMEYDNYQFDNLFTFIEASDDSTVYALNDSKYWYESCCMVYLEDVLGPIKTAVKSVPSDLLKKISDEAKIQVKFGVIHIA